MALNSKNVVKYCGKCHQTGENVTGFGRNLLEYHRGYIFCEDSTNVCEYCGGQLKDTGINKDDYVTIAKISNGNRQLLEAMIGLKQKDIIEYELKMSQFRAQAQQQRTSQKSAVSNNKPKCPTCGSTNVEKISTTSKVVGGALFGLFSSNVRNTMRCKHCGYKW